VSFVLDVMVRNYGGQGVFSGVVDLYEVPKPARYVKQTKHIVLVDMVRFTPSAAFDGTRSRRR